MLCLGPIGSQGFFFYYNIFFHFIQVWIAYGGTDRVPVGAGRTDFIFSNRSGRIWVFGRTRSHIEATFASKILPYRGIRSESRAVSSLSGPLSFGNLNKCSSWPHFARKMLKTLDKLKNVPETLVCGTLKTPSFWGGFSYHHITEKQSFTGVFGFEAIFRWQLIWKGLTLFCNGTSLTDSGGFIHRQ